MKPVGSPRAKGPTACFWVHWHTLPSWPAKPRGSSLGKWELHKYHRVRSSEAGRITWHLYSASLHTGPFLQQHNLSQGTATSLFQQQQIRHFTSWGGWKTNSVQPQSAFSGGCLICFHVAQLLFFPLLQQKDHFHSVAFVFFLPLRMQSPATISLKSQVTVTQHRKAVFFRAEKQGLLINCMSTSHRFCPTTKQPSASVIHGEEVQAFATCKYISKTSLQASI